MYTYTQILVVHAVRELVPIDCSRVIGVESFHNIIEQYFGGFDAAPPRQRVAHLVNSDHAVVIRIDIVELAEAPPQRVAVAQEHAVHSWHEVVLGR